MRNRGLFIILFSHTAARAIPPRRNANENDTFSVNMTHGNARETFRENVIECDIFKEFFFIYLFICSNHPRFVIARFIQPKR